MKKNKLNPVVIWSNLICVLFMAIMVAVLFLPTWEYKEGTLSIAEYLAFPTKKIDLLKGFRDALNLEKVPGVNDVVTIPVFSILLAVLSALVTWLFKKLPLAPVVTTAAGIMGLYGYITIPFYALGDTHLYLIIASAAATVVGLVGLIVSAISLVKAEKKNLVKG